MTNKVACVTGGTGMIGSRIVERLTAAGIETRLLTRNSEYNAKNVSLYKGSIDDENVVSKFMRGGNLLFHCAAELHDKQKMEQVNITGTKVVMDAARLNRFSYVCHISSAGVVGKNRKALIVETDECDPQNKYEQSKYAAELLALESIENCSTVILRPTNVVDSVNPGIVSMITRNRWKDRLRFIIKGKESAHLVHAKKVAAAAMFFSEKKYLQPEVFIIGEDHLPDNTYQGVWNEYCNKIDSNISKIGFTLPVCLPHLIRIVRLRPSNRGDIKFSSEKLLRYGFKDPWTIEDIIKSCSIIEPPYENS